MGGGGGGGGALTGFLKCFLLLLLLSLSLSLSKHEHIFSETFVLEQQTDNTLTNDGMDQLTTCCWYRGSL